MTGAYGVCGTVLRNGLKAREYELTNMSRKQRGDSSCVVGDVTNLEQIQPYFVGKDAIIHLAADARDNWKEVPWESAYTNNILGTYNVYEAARREDVPRVVFASSNHAVGAYEYEYPISSIIRGEYKGIDPKRIPMIDHLVPAPGRPDSYYGVAKIFAEALGNFYSTEYGLSVLCLRIGTTKIPDTPLNAGPRRFSTWLSHRDLTQLVDKCIKAPPELKFDVFYGVSNNTWRFWDISHAKEVIGYEPKDNAEDFRKHGV